jgi:hypothetical protein
VDHLADDTVGSGLNGSLRYCITHATDGDSIQFGVTGTINLTGALPNLSHSISIAGPGPDQLTVRRATGGYYRIFTIGSLTTVAISGITVTNGWLVNDQQGGGGILNYGSLAITNARIFENISMTAARTYNDWGGGIANYGTLAVSFSDVSENLAECDDPRPLVAGGGGIWNGGTLTVSHCGFFNNQADSYDYGSENVPLDSGGGGIFNAAAANLTVTDSTFAYNEAGFGGALLTPFGTGTLTIDNSTISHNGAETDPYYPGGGGIYGNVLHARNTIIAGNRGGGYLLPGGPDLYGNLGSLGHNLIGNTQGGSGFDPSDLLNVDPLLGPLQDNGGPTQTMALLAGSPALNAGDPAQLGVADQRGVVRSGGVNIGAYQASARAFVVTVSGTVASGTPFDVTVQAVDVFGQVAFGYRGTVTFRVTDPDPAVVMPADYTFTADDQGTHTFTGEFILITRGMWMLTTADLANGLSQDVMVTVDS